MYHLRKDTLAFQRARPLMTKHDAKDVPLAVTVANMLAFEKHSGQANVEHGAVSFYFLNHVFSELLKNDPNLPLSPAGAELADAYTRTASLHAQRLFYYMLLICTREARHVHAGGMLQDVLEEYGPQFKAFIQGGMGSSESGAVNRLRQTPPVMTLGQYVKGTVDLFNKCSYSGGYGGPKWGNIANCLRAYIFGEITAEMMVDVAWTLAHNGGPMFNKGMLYETYGNALYKILDVQRSGQMPQFIAQGADGEIADDLKPLIQVVKVALPDLYTPGYVDWFLVEALGAVHSYPNEKKAQVAAYGKSEKVLKAEAMKAKKDAAALVEKQALEAKMFHIGPGEYATIELRKAA